MPVERRRQEGLGQGRQRRERVPAVAHQLRRPALEQQARKGTVHQHREVGVAVRVHEARGDHVAGAVDHLCDIGFGDRREVADGDDPVACDADVGRAARAARAVDDGAAAEEEVEMHRVDRTGVAGCRNRRASHPTRRSGASTL